jgi:hypothetical protein
VSGPSERRKAEREEQRRKEKEAKQARRRSRGPSGLRERNVEVRPEYQRLLVVCEGAKTEPLYFQQFPKRAGDVVTVKGLGRNTLSLVEKALELRDKDGHFDETWVVFDRDSFSPELIEQALALAAREAVHAAWSNEAFELWYLLHFEYNDTARSRDQYGECLTRYLKRDYQKNDPMMYETLLPLQWNAIRNARRLDEQRQLFQLPPADANPCTTVYKLVERLNELSRD